MLIVKSKDEPEIEKKKAKYADGVCSKSFKLNGVKKLLIVGLLPKVQENYHNLMMMLAELDLSGIDQILFKISPFHLANLKLNYGIET